MARLWYLLLLLLAAASVYIGLWPSILTLFALAAIPVAAGAIAGCVSPDAVARRPRVLQALRWGAYVLCTEWVLLLGWETWSKRRIVTLRVQSPPPGRVRIVFDVKDGRPRRFATWHREFVVPATGIVHTQYAADQGWYRKETPHPLRVRIVNDSGATVPAAGQWLRGGFVETAGCLFQYDEYAVWNASNSRPGSGALAPINWLDSLPHWGVDCVDGRLRQSAGSRRTAFPAPHRTCYYKADGGMSCR